jgi:GAF domain-containing protein
MNPPLHNKEAERMDAVHRLNILDTPPDPELDAITKEVTERLHVPISTISILDSDREWFKSCQGVDIKEGPRSIAFCSYALLASDIFIVEDTLEDERFKDNPYVVGNPHVRFYAGMSIIDAVSKLPIGVFCVKDTKPRKLSLEEIGIFMELAEKIEVIINTKYNK